MSRGQIDTEKLKEAAKEAAEKAKENAKNAVGKAKESAKETADKAKVSLDRAKDSLVSAKDATIAKLDADGDGQVSIEDVIVLSLKSPGVYINRASFLKKQLFKNHPQEVIEKAINTTPALAGISPEIAVGSVAHTLLANTEAEEIEILINGQSDRKFGELDLYQFFGWNGDLVSHQIEETE